MHFVAVRAAITKTLAPYVRIIKNFDVQFIKPSVQSIRPLYKDFWRPYLVQNGVRVRHSVADVTLNSCSGQFWLPSTLVFLASCSESDFGTIDQKCMGKL